MRIILLGLALACARAPQPTEESAAVAEPPAVSQAASLQRFELDVPPDVAMRRIHLVLRDLSIPRGSAVLLRAWAVGPDSSRILLGALAVPGVARGAQGVTTLPEMRIDATRGLRQWSADAPAARRVQIEIVADARTEGEAAPRWTVRAVEWAAAR